MSGSQGTGFRQNSTAVSEYNRHQFLITQALARMNTAMLVMVKSVTNSGGISSVGYVTVVPMVHQVDGAGNTTPHGPISNVPYCRVQGGVNAVILDPVPGDIGVAVFASRDISKVKNSRSPGPPNSRRRYRMADAMYLFGALNAAPKQYVCFNSKGIQVVSPTEIDLTAPIIKINATTTLTLDGASSSIQVENGTVGITASSAVLTDTPSFGSTGAVVAGVGSGDVVNLQTHKHASNNSAPTPGT